MTPPTTPPTPPTDRPWPAWQVARAAQVLAATTALRRLDDGGVLLVTLDDGLTLTCDPGSNYPIALVESPTHAGAAVGDVVLPFTRDEAYEVACALLAACCELDRVELAGRFASQDATRAAATAELAEDLP